MQGQTRGSCLKPVMVGGSDVTSLKCSLPREGQGGEQEVAVALRDSLASQTLGEGWRRG